LYGLKFLKQFIHAPRDVGAVLPSSHALADRVCEAARVRDCDTVVEWGCGTGAITEVLLDHLKPDATFFAMEISEDFVQTMAERFPQVVVHHDSAANTRRYLERLERSHCDGVVSGLPWTTFSHELQDELLEALVEVLRPGGRFVTYTYIMSPYLAAGRRFREKLESRFTRFSVSPIVWMNVPPAYVYIAEK
jgi:phosphatidylethanolamine/phosphatidyl-N-methylethanolamine N-methyltransferase